MRTDRFFIKQPLEPGEHKIEDDRVVHQMKTVLRMESGDHLFVFNGDGNEWQATITELTKKTGVISVEKKVIRNTEPERTVHAGISILKKENFELVAQKLVEIGVVTITPVISDHTVKTGINFERLEKIITEAAEQSGRLIVPTLSESKTLAEFIKSRGDLALFHMDGISISSFSPTKEISFLIGPEGGWSAQELTLFKEQSIPFLSLGKTTLRAETAAIVGSHYLVWK